jgi:dolichyl-phosphate-mannose--protein O-mannosyl transferase
MYLYHYLPAVAFLIIGVGVTMSDLVIPRLGSITGKVKGLKLSTILKVLTPILLLLFLLFFFVRYAPFTYIQYLDKGEFNSRVLLKEWNMVWPEDR